LPSNRNRGKLVTFGKADAMAGVADLRLRVLPYAAEHAFCLFDLPVHHADPFDRQIIAQALVENVPVVTPDEAFNLYKGLKVVW
jgi:PIN domain nuclease of toxin-antitoxin system